MTCPFIRFSLGRSLDDGRAPAARLQRHLDRCPDCAGWYRSQQNLAGLLRQPPGKLPDPSPALRRRILTSLGNRTEAARPGVLWWAIPAGAAAILLWSLLPVSPTNERLAVEPADSPAAVADLLAAAGNLPDGSRFLQVAAGLDQPLQREMALLKEDATAALLALRSDFLPDDLIHALN